MQDISRILLMLMGAATGLLAQDPVVCRFTESNQCYVALGQRLHLQLPQEDMFDLQFTDKTSTTRLILKYRKSQSNTLKPNLPTWQFDDDNKTLILTSAERSDSGTYTLKITDVNGNNKGIYNLQLNIEGPSLSILSIVSIVFAILIVITVLAFCIYKKQQGLKKDKARVPDTSGTHANQVKTKEDELHYGEVVFNYSGPKMSKTTKVNEESVYAQIQHGQTVSQTPNDV